MHARSCAVARRCVTALRTGTLKHTGTCGSPPDGMRSEPTTVEHMPHRVADAADKRCPLRLVPRCVRGGNYAWARSSATRPSSSSTHGYDLGLRVPPTIRSPRDWTPPLELINCGLDSRRRKGIEKLGFRRESWSNLHCLHYTGVSVSHKSDVSYGLL